jgi:hypothetical protein
MSRLSRIIAPGLPHRVMQRGARRPAARDKAPEARSRNIVSAVSVPLPRERKNSLQFIATRHCKPLAQSFASDWISALASDQAAGAGDEDLKAQLLFDREA